LTTTSFNTAQSASTGVMKFLVGAFLPIFADVAQIIITFSTQAGPAGLGPEPIIWLHNLGMACLSLGLNIWIGIAMALFPIFLGAGVCSSVSSIPVAINSAIDWLRPFMLAIAGVFILLGVSLGFYLPMHPYLLFTFGVIGWMASVLEAMVAAPLVALGITHPEGHDFLGKSQQAVMLCLGLFLQPVLMLIGLFAGMILCQVSLSVCLYTFSSFCSDIFSATGPASGSPGGDLVLQAAGSAAANVFLSGSGTGWAMLFMPLLVFPLFLAIFAMTVYTITVNCFSLIYQLPNYILTWIGGPQGHGLNTQSMADQMKQSMSNMAKAGDGIGSLLREKGKEKNASKGSLEAKASDANTPHVGNTGETM